MLDTLTFENFQPRVGEVFLAALPDGNALALTLADATPLPAHTYPNQTRVSFSLLFAGPATAQLIQGTWNLTNEAMGTLPVFIVPIRREGDQLIYQAVFT